ncbi:hypothetical protein KCP76_13495 [Salmonella enterica subsp. enterica serovar Weltevreden]|nr:hypothetical protein KCP76_13495 [Salmonella enterica subsp. enterica serovar Weltevreden]
MQTGDGDELSSGADQRRAGPARRDVTPDATLSPSLLTPFWRTCARSPALVPTAILPRQWALSVNKAILNLPDSQKSIKETLSAWGDDGSVMPGILRACRIVYSCLTGHASKRAEVAAASSEERQT